MTKPAYDPAILKKLVGFSLKLAPVELKFVESFKEKTGVSSAEVIRGFINAFRNWFDLPAYMAAELQKKMEQSGMTERQYVNELLAREYERIVHGDGAQR